jgi:flagellin FlaB
LIRGNNREKIFKIFSTRGYDSGSVGIGSLIIFIAMILVAGIVVSVVFDTMSGLQNQALKTGDETVQDISTGVKVTQISGYANDTRINQLAFFISIIAGSNPVNIGESSVMISNAENQFILRYNNTVFSDGVSDGLFSTLNASNLSLSTFGILVIRDIDSSCSSVLPVINENDIVAIIINTSTCFSGIEPRTRISGKIMIDSGLSAIIGFTTPSVYVDKVVDLS